MGIRRQSNIVGDKGRQREAVEVVTIVQFNDLIQFFFLIHYISFTYNSITS
jgi:hypothetical protein